MRVLAGAALAVALLSLGLSIFQFLRIREAELQMAPLRPILEEITTDAGGLRTEVRIPAGTPVQLDIPLDETFRISVDTVISIDTRVTVPLRSPLGNYDIPIPIRADVPVRTVLPLRVREVFRVRTRTPDEIVVPIEMGAGANPAPVPR